MIWPGLCTQWNSRNQGEKGSNHKKCNNLVHFLGHFSFKNMQCKKCTDLARSFAFNALFGVHQKISAFLLFMNVLYYIQSEIPTQPNHIIQPSWIVCILCVSVFGKPLCQILRVPTLNSYIRTQICQLISSLQEDPTSCPHTPGFTLWGWWGEREGSRKGKVSNINQSSNRD